MIKESPSSSWCTKSGSSGIGKPSSMPAPLAKLWVTSTKASGYLCAKEMTSEGVWWCGLLTKSGMPISSKTASAFAARCSISSHGPESPQWRRRKPLEWTNSYPCGSVSGVWQTGNLSNLHSVPNNSPDSDSDQSTLPSRAASRLPGKPILHSRPKMSLPPGLR